MPLAPVLYQVLRSHWQKISRFATTSSLRTKLVLSFADGVTEAYELNEDQQFMRVIPHSERGAFMALSPTELFEKSLTVQSIQTN